MDEVKPTLTEGVQSSCPGPHYGCDCPENECKHPQGVFSEDAVHDSFPEIRERLGWAQEILASKDYRSDEDYYLADLGRVWVRRYEIDVPALLEYIEKAEAFMVEARRGYEEFYEGRAERLLNAESLLREIGIKP